MISQLKGKLSDITEKINNGAMAEYDTAVLKEKLHDFSNLFSYLTEKEKSESLQF